MSITARNNGPSASKALRFAPGTLAWAVADSHNAKIGRAATTYVEQRSCPSSCVFSDGGGCYAEEGSLGKFLTGPLNRAAAQVEATPEQMAAAEADALKVVEGNPLRLHTVGDCKTDEAAATVAGAAGRYVERAHAPAWTYTHAWREVSRDSWGDVNVLASFETADGVRAAEARGYATSIVVDHYEARGLYEQDGIKILPCPAQTKKGVTCASCRLCMDSERLRRSRITIGFAVHGTPLTVKRANLALQDPDNPDRRLSSRVLIPRFIANHLAEHGREPTTRQIAEAVGITPSSVYEMRRRLAAEAAESSSPAPVAPPRLPGATSPSVPLRLESR